MKRARLAIAVFMLSALVVVSAGKFSTLSVYHSTEPTTALPGYGKVIWTTVDEDDYDQLTKVCVLFDAGPVRTFAFGERAGKVAEAVTGRPDPFIEDWFHRLAFSMDPQRDVVLVSFCARIADAYTGDEP